MSRAQHRKPSTTKRNVQRAAAAGITVTSPLTMMVAADSASATVEFSPEVWKAVSDCEAGDGQAPFEFGDPTAENPISTASGAFQITDGTWADAFGIHHASDATFDQQFTRAKEIASARGSLADWSASEGCWTAVYNTPMSEQPVPEPAPEPEADPARAETPAPAAASIVADSYTVQEGDTLVRIGDRAGLNWADIAALNGIVSPWTIVPGQVLQLTVPLAPPEVPVELSVETVTVQTGDTLSGIAFDVGTDWPTLYADNIDVVGVDPNLIFPEQVLTVGRHRAPDDDVDVVPQVSLPSVPTTPDSDVPVVITEEKEQVVVVPDAEVAAAEVATPPFGTAIIVNSYGPVAARAQEAADTIFTQVPGASLITIGGTRSSAIDPHGHPSGNALDYMVPGDAGLGDAIAQYHIDHWDELGVEYVIWQQRIMTSPGGGWSPMEDRGSVTQNHYDHVHVNYDS